MAVIAKKKDKEEKQRLAEVRRAEKEQFEESLRLIKEKIVTAKGQGKHNVVRLLQDKLKQMQENKKNNATKQQPKRPHESHVQKSGKGQGAKSRGRKGTVVVCTTLCVVLY